MNLLKATSEGFPSGYLGHVCPPARRKHQTNFVFSNDARRTPQTPPSCRWPALIIVPSLAKFQLVWRRLGDVLFRSCCVLKNTLTTVCALSEYQSCPKYHVISIRAFILQDFLRFKNGHLSQKCKKHNLTRLKTERFHNSFN